MKRRKEGGMVPGERGGEHEGAVCCMPSSMLLEWRCVEQAGSGIQYC